ncbi:MAG: DUF4401 domain-containing protein [Woeseia sp.]|nr:DUF4401 domain-containing protein [Woeseia sp.]MBT8097809.1 DUF4401 domain-containing protein [Woeseia sp.]NNE59699.1 DUF4401 domain-containing protein [Woeseia sp.]NNL54234.1 DUF4401 domain-containing protein [Woeseia sp.]
MSEVVSPWYLRWVVGIGAWITALVLIAFGGAFVFALLEVRNPAALSVFGAAFFGFGLWLLWRDTSGDFAEQLGIATGAAGAAMICGGLIGEYESFWLGFFVAAALTAAIVAATDDKILQFLTAAFAMGCYVAALLKNDTQHMLDFVALATPVGLVLLLYPPRRDLVPTAVALLLTFPVVSILGMENTRTLSEMGRTDRFANSLHIVLFLALVFVHWRRSEDGKANAQVAAFAVTAVLVCLLLPPGGSAAMLILMLAFVIGSRPLALLGVVLQGQFIIRYYYSLEMTLLDKSLLLIGIGMVLLALWWILQATGKRRVVQ